MVLYPAQTATCTSLVKSGSSSSSFCAGLDAGTEPENNQHQHKQHSAIGTGCPLSLISLLKSDAYSHWPYYKLQGKKKTRNCYVSLIIAEIHTDHQDKSPEYQLLITYLTYSFLTVSAECFW